MKRIFTRCDTLEEALSLEFFISTKGYEGVQNDSRRYNNLMIEIAFRENERHHSPHCFIGVNGCQLVVSNNRKDMRRKGSKHYIRKQRVFKELLSFENEGR